MNPEIWKKNTLDIIQKIADKSYQEQTWVGLSEKISSPDELICELFDDCMFDDFLDSQVIHLSKEQYVIGDYFRTHINLYIAGMNDLSDPLVILHDPKWIEVRSLAKKFIDSFNNE